MESYQSIQEFILQQQTISEWGQARTILAKAAASHPALWRFPLITCRAVGGSETLDGAAAIACAYIAIHLIDDLLDEDPAGKQHHLGAGAVANLASAFQITGMSILENKNTHTSITQRTKAAFNRALLRTAWGQAQDAANPQEEAAYWIVAEDRSAPLFASAFEIGAWLGGASITLTQELNRLGGLYGIMIQISDDLNDALSIPAGPDWLQSRASLPLLYARIVNHPEREHFLMLQRQAADPDCLQEAQAILVRCGAVGYCLDQLLSRGKQAQEILKQLHMPAKDEIWYLFDDLVRPTYKIIASIAVTR